MKTDAPTKIINGAGRLVNMYRFRFRDAAGKQHVWERYNAQMNDALHYAKKAMVRDYGEGCTEIEICSHQGRGIYAF